MHNNICLRGQEVNVNFHHAGSVLPTPNVRIVAGRIGLQPMTSGLAPPCSMHLSYRPERKPLPRERVFVYNSSPPRDRNRFRPPATYHEKVIFRRLESSSVDITFL